MEHLDELWPGGLRLLSDDCHLKLGTDSVLLARFAPVKPGWKVCDLGCGGGALSLLLLARCRDLTVTGLEIQASALDLAARNLALNGLEDRVRLLCGDLRDLPPELPAGSCDLVICNPPYFPLGNGKSAPVESRAMARDERSCTLEDVCTAAGRLLRWGGRLAICHRPERMADLFSAMRAAGIEPKRLQPVQNRYDSSPSLILVEGRRGGKPALSVEAPLLLRSPEGRETGLADPGTLFSSIDP